jgi:ABC-type multidrug transport system fused ATPase/permease subunit
MRNQWRGLFALTRGSRGLLLGSAAISILQSATLIPVALLIRHAFNNEIPDGDNGSLIWIGAAIVGLYLFSSCLGMLTRYISLLTNRRIITRLRIELIEKLYALPRSYFDRVSLGELHGTVVQDTERLDQMGNAVVAQLIPAAVISAGLVGILIFLQPVLFAMLAATIPILIAISVWVGGYVRRRTRDWHGEFDAFTSQTLIALRGMTTTKLHGANQLELDSRRRQLERLGETSLRMNFLQGAYTVLTGAVGAVAGAVVLVAGGAEVGSGDIGLGDLISFFAAVGILRGQALTILQRYPAVISGLESLPRLERILDEEAIEPYRGTRPHVPGGVVGFRGVSFGYGENQVLDGFDLEIGRGEHVAIVGPNGAGKTTVVSLLLGLYAPQAGRIEFDGQPLDEIDIALLRSHIGVVPQDPLLFPGSIAENIAYGREDASEQDIAEAARSAFVDEFALGLPQGLGSIVGDDGILLSGGQRQRIAIARAFIGDPALLVLDEPSTYLDRESLARLIELIRSDNRTLLMVTHDELVARSADRILRLVGGRISEDAKPATPTLKRQSS